MTVDEHHAFLDAEDQADHARWEAAHRGPAIMVGVTSMDAFRQRLDLLNRLFYEVHIAAPRNLEVTHEVTHAAPSPRTGGESYRGYAEGKIHV